MAEVTRTKEFDIAPDELWGLIGDFHGMEKWVGTGSESIEGGTKRKIVMGPNEIVERLVTEGERSYTYAIESGPIPVQNYESTLSVADDGSGKSIVNWVASFDPADGTPEEAAVQIVGMVYDGGLAALEKTLSER